jgi:hypothetical protein
LPVWKCIHLQHQIWNFGRFSRNLLWSSLLLYNFPKILTKHGGPASERTSNFGCRIYEFFSGNRHYSGKFQTHAIVNIPIKCVLINHWEKFPNCISAQSPGWWKNAK